MAQAGLIFPRAPILIVDKQWRIGQSTSDLEIARPADDSHLKVRVMGEAEGTSGSSTEPKKRPSGKPRKLRFVHSSLGQEAADNQTSGDGKPPTRQPKRHPTKQSSTPLETEEAIRIETFPNSSSTAFYGNMSDVRYTELLKYYPVTIGDSFYPLQTRVKFDTNPIGSIWLPYALQDEALLNTIMLASAVQIASFNPIAYDKIMQRLSHSAIEIVNQRMKTKALTDATVGAISCLALIEANLGNQEESSIHHRGLLEVIRLRGGMNSIHPSLQMKIYRAALLPMVDNLLPPRLPRLRRSKPPLYTILDPGPIHEEKYTATLARSGLDLDLIDILLAMRELSHAVEYAMEHKVAIPQQAFDEDTMNLSHELLTRSKEDTTSLNSAGRYAALIYMNTLTREQPLQLAVCQNVSRALMTELESLDVAFSVDNVSFWVIFMGTMASSFTAERSSFRSLLSQSIEKLDLKDWKSCQDRLRSICWIVKIHEEMGLTVWDAVFNISDP